MVLSLLCSNHLRFYYVCIWFIELAGLHSWDVWLLNESSKPQSIQQYKSKTNNNEGKTNGQLCKRRGKIEMLTELVKQTFLQQLMCIKFTETTNVKFLLHWCFQLSNSGLIQLGQQYSAEWKMQKCLQRLYKHYIIYRNL